MAAEQNISPNSVDEALETADVTAPVTGNSAPDIGSSAAIISICTIISRITGFARTWAMAFALGATFLSSSYQVANNLPNMLYELVMGGMLSTAFLPVYMSVKKKQGRKASREYASNLLTIVVLGLGIVSVLCILFSSQVIYTQTFFSEQGQMETSVFFFRFFAIQLVFYGASSIISGLLNANRDYIWGAIAPVFNNLAVIATFIAYAFIAPQDQGLALLVIAIGNPAGVALQLFIQLPGLRRNGILLKPRINFHDPGLAETLRLGVPALLITVIGFVTVSVANAASYAFTDNGPSIIAYSRLWFTFPYSFLAIPVATAMFTELSAMQANEDTKGVAKGIISGISQIFFLMIPFALYLIVFSEPLVSLYHIGAFSEEAIAQIATYLAVMAIALPFYGVNTYLQMVFSSIRRMVSFSVITLVASTMQILLILAAVWLHDTGGISTIEWIAVGTIVAYFVGDIVSFIRLKSVFKNNIGFIEVFKSCARALVLGIAGAAVGAAIYTALSFTVHPQNNIVLILVCVIVAGCAALFVTFSFAIKRKYPEAAFAIKVWDKTKRAVRRRP